MEKKYIIGGLAIVGVIAIIAYLKPTSAKRNSDGFFGADGVEPRKGSTVSGTQCKDSNGDYYVQTGGRPCRGNDKPIRMIVKGQFGGRV